MLPNAVLDRIEVLNTGASSVYGSDAVAGVVNIVTLSKFNGLAVELHPRAGDRRGNDTALRDHRRHVGRAFLGPRFA